MVKQELQIEENDLSYKNKSFTKHSVAGKSKSFTSDILYQHYPAKFRRWGGYRAPSWVMQSLRRNPIYPIYVLPNVVSFLEDVLSYGSSILTLGNRKQMLVLPSKRNKYIQQMGCSTPMKPRKCSKKEHLLIALQRIEPHQPFKLYALGFGFPC